MNADNDTGLLRKIFDAIPSMVFVVDEDVCIHEFNSAAADFLLIERAAILKRRGGEILHCIHSKETPGGCGRAPDCEGCVIRNSVNTAYNGNRVVRSRSKMEVLREGDKTEIYALITASPFEFKGKNLILLVIEDISIIAELQRLIPICSVCHKIKDEEETWGRIEAYFKEHWDVNFTHGYCPDCLQKEKVKLRELIKAKTGATSDAKNHVGDLKN